MKTQIAIARDKYLDGKGINLWLHVPPPGRIYARTCIERAWLDGVTFGVTASVDTRSKVAAPGWMKGRPFERAWLDGVTFGVTASVDTRSKVAAPGWMKGRP